MLQRAFTLERGSKPHGAMSPMHAHDEAQLTFAASGVVQVHTAQGRWLVPSQLGVWIPAGVSHRVEVLTDAELWMVHWKPEVARAWAPPVPLERTFALCVTPLMHSLLNAAFAGETATEKTELVVRLMLHELTETAHAPTFLPLPASAVGRRITAVCFGDSRHALNLDEIASRSATSVRTASRVIQAETGLTFKVWRQRGRIVQAMDLLSRGKSISHVAAELGFASTASLSCAFRQVTAMTPTAFLQGTA